MRFRRKNSSFAFLSVLAQERSWHIVSSEAIVSSRPSKAAFRGEYGRIAKIGSQLRTEGVLEAYGLYTDCGLLRNRKEVPPHQILCKVLPQRIFQMYALSSTTYVLL